MISHKHKCIFIHIPKCAGSSIRDFYFNKPQLDWKKPNYNLLYGWCPKRKIHLQHATPSELIETGLIDEKIWEDYFKFTFVRNPWDRAYSDYLWIKKDSKVNGSFKQYLLKKGEFENLFTNREVRDYRGDHVQNQTNYFGDQKYPLDFVGRFENLKEDIKIVNSKLNINDSFSIHEKNNQNLRLSHYSKFYTNSNIKLVGRLYRKDILLLNYEFEDLRKGFDCLKRLF